MSRRPPGSLLKLALILTAAGLVVGAMVAAFSVMTALPFCADGSSGDECRLLVSTLARRAGIISGIAAVLMALLAAGLLRMTGQQDRDRAERARESYLAAREDGVLAED